MKILSNVFGAAGFLLLIVACLERFIFNSAVFGISAHSVMMGANSLLLLAILGHLYNKD
jgi:hypothetical protein